MLETNFINEFGETLSLKLIKDKVYYNYTVVHDCNDEYEDLTNNLNTIFSETERRVITEFYKLCGNLIDILN